LLKVGGGFWATPLVVIATSFVFIWYTPPATVASKKQKVKPAQVMWWILVNIGLHIVKGGGNLRTEKTAVIFLEGVSLKLPFNYSILY